MATAVKPRATHKATTTAIPVAPTPTGIPAVSAASTKQAQLIALLRQGDGASIAELATALNWLPHTTRASLTGLRKKGHAIVKNKVDEGTRYSIAPATTA